jgi:hypothetical protein
MFWYMDGTDVWAKFLVLARQTLHQLSHDLCYIIQTHRLHWIIFNHSICLWQYHLEQLLQGVSPEYLFLWWEKGRFCSCTLLKETVENVAEIITWELSKFCGMKTFFLCTNSIIDMCCVLCKYSSNEWVNGWIDEWCLLRNSFREK